MKVNIDIKRLQPYDGTRIIPEDNSGLFRYENRERRYPIHEKMRAESQEQEDDDKENQVAFLSIL